jgi:superfamily II DNA or RNA helicase
MQYTYQRTPVEPAHREALSTILHTEKARTHVHYGTGQWLSADAIGPGLWTLLDEALAAGVTLVHGPRGGTPVVLRDDPATLVLDATRVAASPGYDDGDIVVRPLWRVPGATGEAVPVGSPAHGLFIAASDGLTLARLTKPLTPTVAGLVDSVDSLTIPAADTARFLTHYYPVLRQRASVESSDGSVEFPEIHPPRLALRVTFEEDHRTRLAWTFRYTVGTAHTDVPLARTPHADPSAAGVTRDAAAEEALLAGLDILDAAPGLKNPQPGGVRAGVAPTPTLQGWPTILFVRDVLPALLARDDIEVTVIGSPLDYVEFDGAPVVSVSAHDIGQFDDGEDPVQAPVADWFDLGILVTVGGVEVPLVTLLTALARGDDRLILGGGTWFSLDRPELHALRRIVEEARALEDREPDRLRINRYQAGLWEELVSLGVVAHQSERWERSVGALLALQELPNPEPPQTLDARLRPYQVDGYQWLSFLWEHQLGGILADDMGLGKTLQTLAMAERARVGGTLITEDPILVVAPTSVVAAWQKEAAKFTPGLEVTTLTQTVRRSGTALSETVAGAHIVVTSYALFRIDAEHYTDRSWGALILDEAQFVKNHQSRTYQVARTLRAPVKIAITGTPLENSLMDLWALLSITAPGLFPSPKKFAELFRKPIESGSSPELLATLRRRIRPLMLRRTKEAVARDLPPKVEQVVSVPLNAGHRRIYDTHLQRERQRILGLLDDVDRNRIAILSALTQLRQLSLDVHLVDPDAPAAVRSSKIDALIDQLVEVAAEGHRCLVFSQFTRFLQIVRKRLDAEGIKHVYLDGRTRNRPKRIAEFTEGDAPAFLISLKAGGSGLTLTQADYVFVLDPWWNPAVEAQAVDRTHRIGQDKTVMVYRLVSEGTIEEKVVALQERKRELFARVVDDGGLMGAPLTADDIRGLLEG